VTIVIGSSLTTAILLAMVWLYDLGSRVLGLVAANPLVALIVVLATAIVFAALARRLGVIERARRHPRATVALLVPILAIALPLGWYLASPLVLTASIDEPAPAHASAAVSPFASTSPPSSAESPGGSRRPSAPTAAPTTPPAPIALAGSFHGSDDFHFGRGTARLIEVAPGSFIVRLEDFAVRNGPDLYVYLSRSADGYATGAIELGRLKADTGNQNYAVPAGAFDDPADVASVVIWCRQFSHLFATAPLRTG
jgi:hypothetical protein